MTRVHLDEYILDTLMPDLVGHDRQPSAFLVYLFLWRLTGGRANVRRSAALREIVEGTGLSKRAVQEAVARLRRRGLIEVDRAGVTAIPEYRVLRPWRRRSG